MERPLDADPARFRLASEAYRIGHAAALDPMLAASTADVTPLPHQILAVYRELLPRVPLRFLLADDPGAGKTIMAGLYLKELVLRGACQRALIVAPGSLVDQWCEEMRSKFQLDFAIVGEDAHAQDGDPFAGGSLLVARMDQLARRDDWRSCLPRYDWDVIIVDEAHRMSAHVTSMRRGPEKTLRYQLGEQLSGLARQFLLMTATPHNGNEADFQVFLRLLDPDRFTGLPRRAGERADTHGVMRRLVKEDLLTFEGKPLFPRRVATTLAYTLSPAELSLYESVSAYVRTEMGRVDRLLAQGQAQRGHAVGFALTLLQRRLASSPRAVLRSLERRRDRLRQSLEDGEYRGTQTRASWNVAPDEDAEDWEDSELLHEVWDAATAARSRAELEAEVASLDVLVIQARAVEASGRDAKWAELRTILTEEVLSPEPDGSARKIIIFTEHRDTLNYLVDRIGTWMGRPAAVAQIQGGLARAERLAVCESFTHDPAVQVLVATDAAGEGLNLHRAHLMVNYDLPWNPNRLEQRFGRIHRIGQQRTCYLWSLVAEQTREGQVYQRLLQKIAVQEGAYHGNLFHVLGQDGAFGGASLRDLLMRAVREADSPQSAAYLDRVIDAGVAASLESLREEDAMLAVHLGDSDVRAAREQMEQARLRRLQPGYVRDFCLPAIRELGGAVYPREPGRFEVTRTPFGLGLPSAWERVTFDPDRVMGGGCAPGRSSGAWAPVAGRPGRRGPGPAGRGAAAWRGLRRSPSARC